MWFNTLYIVWKCEKWILYTTFQPLIFCSKAYVFWKLPSACRTQSQVINHWFCVPLLLVLEQATQNSKTQLFLLLKFQTRWNLSLMFCIFEKLILDRTWNTSKYSRQFLANSSSNSIIISKNSFSLKSICVRTWIFQAGRKLAFDCI